MRESKFIAWDAGTKTMSPVRTITGLMRDAFDQAAHFPGKDHEKVKEFFGLLIFREWTGLKDVKGEDLYEGDIIDVYDMERDCCCKKCFPEDDDPDALDECEKLVCRQEVKWSDHAGYFCEKDTGEYCPSLGADELELERVGNIYENPELLNV